jgi:hypothetical protein
MSEKAFGFREIVHSWDPKEEQVEEQVPKEEKRSRKRKRETEEDQFLPTLAPLTTRFPNKSLEFGQIWGYPLDSLE